MGMPVIVGSDVTRDQSVTDIVQSVALEQTALSHILNAEGEKIQRVVADKEITTTELLAANKSVESMVNSITKLEIILQSKLALFDNCLNNCDIAVTEPVKEETVEEPAVAKEEVATEEETVERTSAAVEPETEAEPEIAEEA
ncbi:MAG: hypothetical protein R3Y27_06035 [Clostridia bacterium]